MACSMCSKYLDEIARLREENENLKIQCMSDPLTGISNRSLFMDRLNQALEYQKRNKHYIAVIFIDLDGFKPINDAHGHNAGDFTLKIVAERLTKSVRKIDTVARYAGDEFAILLNQINNKNDVYHISEKILKTIQSSFVFDEKILNVGASIGVVVIEEPSSLSGTDVINYADMAMYKAKKTGKNKICYSEDV